MTVNPCRINGMGESRAASPEADAPTHPPYVDNLNPYHDLGGFALADRKETSPEQTAASYAIGRDDAGWRNAQRKAHNFPAPASAPVAPAGRDRGAER